MRSSPIKTSFNGGEWSPLTEGRVDLAKYANACKQVKNLLPLTQGSIVRRAGTKFVTEVKDSTKQTWLATFVFNYQQAFVLEFGVGYIRLFTQRSQVAVTGVADWDSGTDYIKGDIAASGGTNYYCILDHTNHTPPNATYWYALPGDILEIPTPFTAGMLTNDDGTFGLSMVQSGDVIYICCRDYPPQKLSRYSNTFWTIETVAFDYGAFEDINSDQSITVYAGAQSGTGVTFTASTSGVFSNLPVGGLFYLQQNIDDSTTPWEAAKSISTNDLRSNEGKNYKALNTATTGYVPPIHTIGSQYDGDGGVQWNFQNPTFGIARKTVDIVGGTTMTADVIHQIPAGATGSGNTSWIWARAAWDYVAGFPTHVTFFRQRLVFARDRTLWFSVIADYENFATQQYGVTDATSAFTVPIDGADTSQITYLSATKQGLVVGTTSGELLITESSTTEVFSAANVKVSISSGYGSRSIAPIHIEDAVLFIQRGGIKLRESQYNFQLDNFTAIDLTTLSEHITSGGIVDIAYQLNPYSIIWQVRSDGVLIGFTYNKNEEVLAWHRHILGGSYGGGAAVVESVAVIPSPDGLRDDLWLIVKRSAIDGSIVRYIEYMQAEYISTDDREDAFYVDCGLTYNGSPADMIDGLDHLIGETVQVLVDGAAHPDCIVNGSGEITLNAEYSVVHVGLKYESLLQTMRIEAGAQDGTSQGKIKRINYCIVRMLNTGGAKISIDNVIYNDLAFRAPSDLMDTAVPFVTGDRGVAFEGADTDGYIYIKQSLPLPMTILAIMPQVTTEDYAP